jgi:3-hydroxyisobutyrate dehydrogenase
MGDHPGGQVGWLGTGRMGSVLIRRLLAAGMDVLVYNRTKARAVPLAAAGAKIVDHASDLAAAQLVFIMVGTSKDLVTRCSGRPA